MNVLEAITGGNPFNTPVGQRIEKATDGSLPGEDWTLNMEICDIINETDEGPKEAIRAIRKRVNSSMGKDWRAITYCLVVLETAVKNCGKRLHMQLAHKDFLNDLVKIILPKNEPPVIVQEKFLSLIQIWADAFRGAPELKAVEGVYQDLKNKGIEFPATDLDQMAPIHTPKGNTDSPIRISSVSAPTHPAQQPARAPPVAYPAAVPGGGPAPPLAGIAPHRPTAEQMSKLRNDIDIVQGNCRVFNEMLNVATPGSTELTTDTTELLRELNRTCRQMQQRIVILLEQLADEQVTEVLLRVNDDLNNAFLRYDRMERFLNISASPAAPTTTPAPSVIPSHAAPPPPAATAAAVLPTTDQSLIDFGASEPTPPPRVSASALAAHVDGMNLSATTDIASIGDIPTNSSQSRPDADEFAVFAQSRQHTTAATYAFQTEAAQNSTTIGSSAAGRSNPYATEPSVTSSEFDQFLEERVAAGEKLPDAAPESDGSSSATAPSRGGGRQMNKDESENALFAL